MISGFRRGVNKIVGFLGFYTAYFVVIYRRFGTTYRSHFQGSGSPRRTFFIEKFHTFVRTKKRHIALRSLHSASNQHQQTIQKAKNRSYDVYNSTLFSTLNSAALYNFILYLIF